MARYVFDVGNWDNCTWIVLGGASGDPASPLHWLGACPGSFSGPATSYPTGGPSQSALLLLGVVALLGITVVDRWHGSGRHAVQQGDGRGFPVWSATVHVMAATATLVLVALITLVHVGT